MEAPDFLFLDGKAYRSDKLLISPDNRSFRYGDGFFETMKYQDGQVLLGDLHFERLFESLNRMHFKPPSFFTRAYLEHQIDELVKKNGQSGLLRLRLTIFRGFGGIHDVENHFPHHLIQSWKLNPANSRYNENGLVIDIYKDAQKTADQFSSIKSNNYLNYAMAALWAKKQRLNDAILLNAFDRVADATIANVFIVKDGAISTPALDEGPVGGVMRRYVLKKIRDVDIPVQESRISVEDLEQACEIFLTNAIYGIRWVKQINNNQYMNDVSRFLHQKIFVKPI